MEEIISVRLMGGLGNQLFQYATAYALARRQHKKLLLDTRFFDNYTLHGGYKLDKFNISGSLLSAHQLRYFPSWHIHILQRMPSLSRYLKQWILEQEFRFRPIECVHTRPVNLVGYWQSEKYFSEFRDEIIGEFQILSPPPDSHWQHYETMQSRQSVAVHIRRGDYLSNPAAMKTHGFCSLGYYMQALALLNEKLINPHFYFFSDDIDWTIQQFSVTGFTDRYTYVTGGSAEADLWLMSNAKHHVIANSTFSWWAAWLAPTQTGKLVICPSPWFATELLCEDDLIPASWIKIDKNQE